MKTSPFIDPQHGATFEEEGYVILDLLSPSSVASLLEVFHSVEAEHAYDFVASVLLPDHSMRHTLNAIISPIFEKEILPVLDGYKIILGNFASKRAQSFGKMPLHQDSTFVDEHETIGITIWCPLVDVSEENGWLGLVPGSHKLGNYYREAISLPYPEVYDAIENSYLTYLPMKAGQVLLMDNRMIHGSQPNKSNAVRPVAAGVAVETSATLLCCYNERSSADSQTEIYEVPQDFYERHMMMTRPQEGTLLRTVPAYLEPLTIERLEALRPVSAVV